MLHSLVDGQRINVDCCCWVWELHSWFLQCRIPCCVNSISEKCLSPDWTATQAAHNSLRLFSVKPNMDHRGQG